MRDQRKPRRKCLFALLWHFDALMRRVERDGAFMVKSKAKCVPIEQDEPHKRRSRDRCIRRQTLRWRRRRCHPQGPHHGRSRELSGRLGRPAGDKRVLTKLEMKKDGKGFAVGKGTGSETTGRGGKDFGWLCLVLSCPGPGRADVSGRRRAQC